MARRRKPYCPVNGWDCPYWNEDSSCNLGDEEAMISECDDAYYLLGDFEEGDD